MPPLCPLASRHHSCEGLPVDGVPTHPHLWMAVPAPSIAGAHAAYISCVPGGHERCWVGQVGGERWGPYAAWLRGRHAAYGSWSLHAGDADAVDDVTLEDQHEQDRRQCGQGGTGHQHPPVVAAGGAEVAEVLHDLRQV